MDITALILLGIFTVAGLAAIFFTSIGTLIILIGAVIYALMTGLAVLEVKHLILLSVLYLCGEAAEFLLSVWGAKRFGASNRAVVGALLGGIAGAIFGAALFGVGIFLGTLLGIFLGAVAVEYLAHKNWRRSFKAGTGGVLGRVGAIGVKVLIAVAMIGIMAARIRAG